MTDSDSEKTCPPRKTLREDDLAALWVQMPLLQRLIKLQPRTGENALQFLGRLRSSTIPEDAVTFTAFAALPTAAAGWGYECLRLMADHLHPYEKPMMQDIAGWLAQPSTAMRHQIMKNALFANSRAPSVLLGLAVGWSTGAPAPNDPEPAPPHKVPQAINSAVLSCLARTDLARRPIYLARFLDAAETLFRAY